MLLGPNIDKIRTNAVWFPEMYHICFLEQQGSMCKEGHSLRYIDERRTLERWPVTDTSFEEGMRRCHQRCRQDFLSQQHK